MLNYHVVVRPVKRPDLTLFMARRFRDIHDGPFTESFDDRLIWHRPGGPLKKIADEKLRKNRVYGRLTYTVIQEPACIHCGRPLQDAPSQPGAARWLDELGGDACNSGDGGGPHEPG